LKNEVKSARLCEEAVHVLIPDHFLESFILDTLYFDSGVVAYIRRTVLFVLYLLLYFYILARGKNQGKKWRPNLADRNLFTGMHSSELPYHHTVLK